MVEMSSVVLTSHDVQTLSYLGDFDIVVNNNRMSEIRGRRFGIDPRTGRPVVSEPEAARLVMQCYPDGLVVAVASQWRSQEAISPRSPT